jgi:predicted GNAT family acetyltransferase
MRDGACRYEADVAPFAAVSESTTAAWRCLRDLLLPGESTWLFDKPDVSTRELETVESLACYQMVLPHRIDIPSATHASERIPDDRAHEMVELTDVAFPGFFRPRTHMMGQYHGIRRDGTLVAMGGERLMLDGYPEISGVCTHPDHRGCGYATQLVWDLVRLHRAAGLTPWLHVGVANTRAMALYRNLGFEVIQTVTLNRIRRID